MLAAVSSYYEALIVRTLNLFVYKNNFFPFNPNLGYGNQRRIFYGNLSGMLFVLIKVFSFYCLRAVALQSNLK